MSQKKKENMYMLREHVYADLQKSKQKIRNND